MKKYLIFSVICLLLAIVIASNQSSSPSNSGYSDKYKTDSKYRSNVNSVADTYGKSSLDVDRSINAVADLYD